MWYPTAAISRRGVCGRVKKLVRLSLYIGREKELHTKDLSKRELVVQLMVVFWGIRDPDSCPMDDIFDVEVWWLQGNIEGTRRRLRGAPTVGGVLRLGNGK